MVIIRIKKKLKKKLNSNSLKLPPSSSILIPVNIINVLIFRIKKNKYFVIFLKRWWCLTTSTPLVVVWLTNYVWYVVIGSLGLECTRYIGGR